MYTDTYMHILMSLTRRCTWQLKRVRVAVAPDTVELKILPYSREGVGQISACFSRDQCDYKYRNDVRRREYFSPTCSY